MPRAARLRQRADFGRVYGTGVRARAGLILAVGAPTDAGLARLGLSVGRRWSRSAVERNRAKRQLREAFRLERHQLPELDLILIPVAPVGDPKWTLPELRRELRKLCAKLVRRLEARAEEAEVEAPVTGEDAA